MATNTDRQLHEQLAWTKSSFSSAGGNGGGGDCLETARLSNGDRATRDSKAGRDGSILLFPPAKWAQFVRHVSADGFQQD